MTKILSVLLGVFCVCALCRAQTATVRTALKNGKTVEKTIQMQKADDGALTVFIPKSEIPADAKYVDVVADFAVAKKGDDGYWVFSRGILGTYKVENGSYWRSPQVMPIFGMKTPENTFWALLETLRFESEIRVEAKDGIYTMFPRYLIADIPSGGLYDDIKISFHFLKGDDANYAGMARAYRNYRLALGEIKPIKERMKTSPWLEKLANSYPLRCGHMSKKRPEKGADSDFTPETEPKPIVHRTFAQTMELFKKAKASGLDNLSICITSWQTGGDDGRCPSTFPIPPELGGEEKLKEMIKLGQDLGYVIDGHSNFTDAYRCSPMWNEDLICEDKNGKLVKGGVWCGGQSYHLCLKSAWKTFLPADIKHIGELGFRGAHYIDVFSATSPYACADPKHPLTRDEAAKYQLKIMREFKKNHTGMASECGYDHLAGELDYINYVSPIMRIYRESKSGLHPMIDGFVPFWEIVYHGIILSNPDKITQGLDLPQKDYLKLVEFGGRPIYYGFSERALPLIKKDYDLFQPLKYLQFEYMENHQKLADGVFLTTFGDGSRIIVNYNSVPFDFEGVKIAPLGYKLLKPKSK